MAKDPVPHDVMTMLIALAHRRDGNAQARRIRFEAVFSACNGQIADHPEIALTWLWKLHGGVTQPRQASIRKSCRAAFSIATRQSPEQTMLLAVALMNHSPDDGKLQCCAARAFVKAFDRALENDPRTDRSATFANRALRQIGGGEQAQRLADTIFRRLVSRRYGEESQDIFPLHKPF